MLVDFLANSVYAVVDSHAYRAAAQVFIGQRDMHGKGLFKHALGERLQ